MYIVDTYAESGCPVSLIEQPYYGLRTYYEASFHCAIQGGNKN